MNTKSGIAVSLSLLSLFLINLVPSTTGIIIAFIISVCFLIVVLKSKLYSGISKTIFLDNKGITFLAGVVSLCLGMRFINAWIGSKVLLALCFHHNLVKNLFLFTLTFVLAVGCFLVIVLLLKKLAEYLPDDSGNAISSEKKLSLKAIVIILITSVICITICSKSSPIYPFNNWVDVNAFFTVGKSVTNDMVIYKDIYEQKGPILYFLFTVVYLISHTTFVGAYVLEIITCFCFLLISYKTLCLFTSSRIIYTFPILAVIIYSSPALSLGGSAEEICLPCVALCHYFGIKSIVNGKRIRLLEWLIIGITSGAILWVKFSLLGFYIGFGLVFAVIYLKNRWIKDLFQAVASLFAGVLLISVPVLVYFIINSAVADLYQVYFYDNIFVYSVNDSGNRLRSLIENLCNGFSSAIDSYLIGFVMIFAGFIFLLRKKDKLMIYSLTTLLFSFFFIYSGGRSYKYYSFLLSVYVPFGILLFVSVIRCLKEKYEQKKTAKKPMKRLVIPVLLLTYALCVFCMYSFCPNTYMLKYSKEDLPQYKFDKYISETENPTLLNYGYRDNGFYTVSDIMPTCKYFCKINMPKEEIKKTQDYYVENGLIDYVVTTEETLDTSRFNQYEYVSAASFENTKNSYREYYLYQKKH